MVPSNFGHLANSVALQQYGFMMRVFGHSWYVPKLKYIVSTYLFLKFNIGFWEYVACTAVPVKVKCNILCGS